MAEFHLTTPGKKGQLLSHLLKVREQRPEIAIPELDEFNELSLPSLLEDFYFDFLELNLRREFRPQVMSSQGNTISIDMPMPISYKDIEAWAFCFGIELSSIQVSTIMFLDAIWLHEYRKNNK